MIGNSAFLHVVSCRLSFLYLVVLASFSLQSVVYQVLPLGSGASGEGFQKVVFNDVINLAGTFMQSMMLCILPRQTPSGFKVCPTNTVLDTAPSVWFDIYFVVGPGKSGLWSVPMG